MKVVVVPTNYSIILRDSNDELVGSAIITEQSPQTFLYSLKTAPNTFNAMNFVFDFEDKSITVNSLAKYKEQTVIELGADEQFGTFVFVDTEDIEPCVSVR